VIHPELIRLRRGAAQSQDPKAHYRFRVDALRAGFPVRCQPGDRVRVGDGEARVVGVSETAGPPRVVVRAGDGAEQVLDEEPKIAKPHRPAVLLGEAELIKRFEADLDRPGSARLAETAAEVARRGMKEGIPVGLRLLARLDAPPAPALHQSLTALFKSRPPGEVEVDLRHADASGPRVELPALAASVTDVGEAREVLDRLEALEPADAKHVVEVCGRWLVGLGGPGFVDADVRGRVAALARTHPDADVRRALFVNAAKALVEESLLEGALGSEDAVVREAAAAELLRRGKADPVWAHLRQEAGVDVTLAILRLADDAPGVAPVDLLARWLELADATEGPAGEELRERALLRAAECRDREPALALLEPWVAGEKEPGLGAAVWAAGLLGTKETGDRLLRLVYARAAALDAKIVTALALEALARLEHPRALEALDAWGVDVLKAGTWAEEIVDTVGLVLRQPQDAQDLLNRFVLDPPKHPARRARPLEIARALLAQDQTNVALRVARDYLPSRLERFEALTQRG